MDQVKTRQCDIKKFMKAEENLDFCEKIGEENSRLNFKGKILNKKIPGN